MTDRGNEGKAVNNPRVRLGDPACWKCLSDEQRDIINEWYMRQIFNRMSEQKKKEEEEERLNSEAAVFAISPFAFYAALKYGMDSIFKFFSTFFSVYLFYFFIASLFFYGYQHFMRLKDFSGKLDLWIFRITALIISFFITFTVLNRAGIV